MRADRPGATLAREFLDALAAAPEGDGTLLDNCVVLAHSDRSLAKAHAFEGMPIIVAGGRIRTGDHMADPSSGIGLTVQRAMGLQVERWDTLGMETNRSIADLLV